MRTTVAVALALALAPLSALPAAPLYTEARAGASRPRAPAGLPELSAVAKSVLPAVVGIATTQPAPGGATDADPVRGLYDPAREPPGPRAGLATGFVIHEAGWIVTNAHVVDGAAQVEVDLGDEGGRLPARLVGADPLTDVALLKVEARHALPFVELGDSDRLEIAEWLLVVGNPFGLAQTVTLGIVSQLGRADIAPQGKDGYYDFIQTDASINPGNSGGPLVNLRGEVVGIATAINVTGQGIGFAIPINMAKEVLAQLRAHGRMIRAWMGVSVRELPREQGERTRTRGVMVTAVDSRGPAASAGLSPGDVITAFDGREVPSPARLRWLVASAGVGRRVPISVRRGAAERAFEVELSPLPAPERAP
jgi:serine protease Do